MDEAKKAQRKAEREARKAAQEEAERERRIKYSEAIKASIESGSGVTIRGNVTALNYEPQSGETFDWLSDIPHTAELMRNWGVYMPRTLPAWETDPDGRPLVKLHTGCFSYIILSVWWREGYWVWEVSFHSRRDDLGDDNTLYKGCADEPENAIRIAEWIYYALLHHRYPPQTLELESVLRMRKNYTTELKLRAR